MAVNFTPSLKPYSGQGKFRYWVQMVLPTIYDDSLSYMELLNNVVYVMNLAIEDVNTAEENVAALLTAFNELQQYTNDYFDNLDVQEEIDNKLDEMVEDGTFTQILQPLIQNYQNQLDLLEARVDNLARAITPGTTSADAELIDVRVGYNGTIYPTAGDSVRTQIKQTYSEMKLFNVDEILWDNTSPESTSYGGVVWTVDNTLKTINANTSGAASSSGSALNLYYNLTDNPSWLKKNTKYYMHMSTDTSIAFEIFVNDGTSTTRWKTVNKDNPYLEFIIPDDLNVAIIRLFVASGETINDTVSPFISSNLTISELEDKVVNNQETKLDKSEASLFDLSELLWNNTSFDTTTVNGVTYNVNKTEREISINSGGVPSTGAAPLNLYYDLDNNPDWLEKGKKYYMHMLTNSDVRFEIFVNDGTSTTRWKTVDKNNPYLEFIIPDDLNVAIIRLFVARDVTIDSVVRPMITQTLTLGELTKVSENIHKKSLKILFIGHSLLQDESTYVPWIMEEVAPELELTMAIAYNSSTWISGDNGFNNNFDNTSFKFDIYSKYKTGDNAWSNSYNVLTIKNALDDEDWDVIVICESAKWNRQEGVPDSDVTHYEAFGEFLTKMIEYTKKPIKYGAMLPHSRYSTNDYSQVVEDETSFIRMVEQYKQQIVDKYAIEFFIPGFTAYFNSENTVLVEYGSAPNYHMLADSGHYQEGIGCLLGSYVTTLVLLNVAGINNRSILGNQIDINNQWVIEHNIPGINPNPVSVTGMEPDNVNRNRIIAQKCAVMAVNRPWNITQIT